MSKENDMLVKMFEKKDEILESAKVFWKIERLLKKLRSTDRVIDGIPINYSKNYNNGELIAIFLSCPTLPKEYSVAVYYLFEPGKFRIDSEKYTVREFYSDLTWDEAIGIGCQKLVVDIKNG